MKATQMPEPAEVSRMVMLDLLKFVVPAAAAGAVLVRLWRQLFIIVCWAFIVLLGLGIYEAVQIVHHLNG
jgi:hypothetical protein